MLVEVPGVNGAGVDEATMVMQEAGFEVQTEHSDLYVGLEFVVDTDPKAGTMVPQGSLVTLFLV